MKLATHLHLVAESMNEWSDISTLSSASAAPKMFLNFDPTSVGIRFCGGRCVIGMDFFDFPLSVSFLQFSILIHAFVTET